MMEKGNWCKLIQISYVFADFNKVKMLNISEWTFFYQNKTKGV